jgi:hypothetical protein
MDASVESTGDAVVRLASVSRPMALFNTGNHPDD